MTTPTSPLRASIKRGVERVLASSLAARLGRRRRRGSRLILAYHNVVQVAPDVGSDRSLHLCLADFRAQLDSISAAGLQVVALDAPLDESAPQVSITFDDAYVGALLHGIPELARRGWPSTLFVAPALLGSPAPWWDRLAVPGLEGIPARVRDRALWDCEGDETAILQAVASNGWHCAEGVEGVRIGTESEVASAIALDPALTIGAHSWSHANLAAVSPERLRHELDAPLAWLRQRWRDRVIPWLAYPYGIASASVRSEVTRAGYSGALRVEGGWHSRRSLPAAVPRFNVPARLSPLGFRARLGGMFG